MENRQQTLLRMADELKLSKTTVSVCLSGNAEKYKIKPDTVERVKKHAEKINYIPNRIARSLTKPGNAPVGLIMCQNSSSEKSLHAMRRAMRMLDESGREFIVQNFLEDHVSDAVAALKGMNVREIIMFGSFREQVDANRFPQNLLLKFHADQTQLAALLQNMRFYSVDYEFPFPENSKLPNIYRLGINRGNIYAKLFTALLKAGKTPIVCDENCIPGETMRNLANLGVAPVHILTLPDNMPDANPFRVGFSLVSEIIERINVERIKSVIIHDDKVAAGLIKGLLANGYSVPDDIAVVGFDNIDAAEYFRIPLTTIELPVMENTIMVVDAILKGKEVPKVIESEGKILWRDSAKL